LDLESTIYGNYCNLVVNIIWVLYTYIWTHTLCYDFCTQLNRKLRWQVWAGPLSKNKVAVVLWNRSSSNATVTASWSDIGLEPETIVDARDLWEVKYLVTLIILFQCAKSFKFLWFWLCVIFFIALNAIIGFGRNICWFRFTCL